MDEAHDKKIKALEGLLVKCDELARHGRAHASCIRLEEARALTAEERKDKGWSARPYYAYDPAHMCPGCAACWHANMVTNLVRDEIRGLKMAASEARRRA